MSNREKAACRGVDHCSLWQKLPLLWNLFLLVLQNGANFHWIGTNKSGHALTENYPQCLPEHITFFYHTSLKTWRIRVWMFVCIVCITEVKRFWVLLTSAFFSISKLFTPFRTHELHFSIFTAILQCLYFWSFSVCLNFLMKQSFFSVAQRIEAWRSNEKDISLVIAIQSDHFSHILCTHCRVPWCHVLLKEW